MVNMKNLLQNVGVLRQYFLRIASSVKLPFFNLSGVGNSGHLLTTETATLYAPTNVRVQHSSDTMLILEETKNIVEKTGGKLPNPRDVALDMYIGFYAYGEQRFGIEYEFTSDVSHINKEQVIEFLVNVANNLRRFSGVILVKVAPVSQSLSTFTIHYQPEYQEYLQ
jgi:hypothetical protein